MNNSYLLLNTEIHDSTYLFGFELFAPVNGTVDLKVNNNGNKLSFIIL